MRKTRDYVYIGLMAALTAVLSQIMLPMPSGVPVTLQTFAVALAGFTLGAKRGAAAVGVYLALGAVGVPVFTGMMGGFGKLFGVTGGFLFGFPVLAFFCGLASERKNKLASAFVSAPGLAVCHLMGTAYYAFIAKTGIAAAFIAVSLPYILKDIAFIAGAWAVSRSVKRALNNFS